jgi:hypothetical protein
MVLQSIKAGFRSARCAPGLVAMLYCWLFILAALAAAPAWLWLRKGFDLALESDKMLGGFQIGVFSELAQYDRSSISGLVMAALTGVLLLGLMANPLVAGGLIETLLGSDDVPALQKFFRGAGRYFWRYLSLLAYTLMTAALLLAILTPAFTALDKRLRESLWEPAPMLGSFVKWLVMAALGAFLLLSLDFSRIRTATEDSRRTLRVWFASLRLVGRRGFAMFGILAFPVALFAGAAALYGVFSLHAPSHTWLWILLLLAIQQAMILLRSGLRVALVSSEIACYQMLAAKPEPVRAEPAAISAAEVRQSQAMQAEAQDDGIGPIDPQI